MIAPRTPPPAAEARPTAEARGATKRTDPPKPDRCPGGMSPPCAVCVCGDAGDLDDTTLSWR